MAAAHDRLLSFYDNRAPTYDTEDPAFHNRLATDFANWAASYLPSSLVTLDPSANANQTTTDAAPATSRAVKHLDLCCGTGLVSFATLARFGPETEVHGVDFSPRSLDVARAKCPSRTTTVHFHQADVTQTLPSELEGQTFDLITCCSAFCLFPLKTNDDRVQLVKRWAERLSPGGVLLFDVPAPGTQVLTEEMTAALQKYCGFDGDDGRGWIKSDSSVEDMLSDAGFEDELSYVFESETYKRVEVAADGLLGVWERMVGMPYFAGGIKGVDADKKEQAKEMFIERMKGKDKEDGKIIDEYKFFIAVARKSDDAEAEMED